MPVSDATIGITNLRLRTYIGFNTEEREKSYNRTYINTKFTHFSLIH
jgi:hypothetical protein